MKKQPYQPQVFPGLPVPEKVNNQRPLRVCVVSPEFNGPTRNGGVGTAYTAISHALAARGHDVTCLYLDGKVVASGNINEWIEKYRRDGLKLVPLQPMDSSIVDVPRHQSISNDVYAWLKKQKAFDVIHFPEWQGPGYYSLLAKQQGLAFGRTTLCVGTHGMTTWLKHANREFIQDAAELEMDFMERQSVAMADVLFSPSQYLLNWVGSRGWTFPKQTFVQQYILPPAARLTGGKVSCEFQEVSELVFFGRLETRKGVVLFCDAMDKLGVEAKGRLRTVTFLGRETTVEGVSARAYIQKRSKDWQWKTQILSDRGHSEAIDYLRQKGRLAVIASLAENSPNTVYECLGAGIAFVASRAGGIPELIAKEDSDRICFDTKPERLSALLGESLEKGCRTASMAVDPLANEQAWVAWHEGCRIADDEAENVTPSREPVDWPKISICVTTYNRPALLRQTIAGIHNIDYPNFEVVLVDDGSNTPDALEYLRELKTEFAQHGWKVIQTPNRYLGAARNEGVRNSTGEYLLFMDDDNVATPHLAKVLMKSALNSSADVVTCGSNYFTGSNAPLQDSIPANRWLPLGASAPVGALRNCFGDANALVRKQVFEELGGFTEDYGLGYEDWEFFAKAVLKGYKLTVVPEFLFWYRVTPNSMLRTMVPHANLMRSIRPYVDAVPEQLHELVYFAQGEYVRQAMGTTLTAAQQEEMRVTVAWRSKLEAARVFVQQNQPDVAAKLLREAVKGVEESQNPKVIFEALSTVGRELRPIDQERGTQMIKLALQLAVALKHEGMQAVAEELLGISSKKISAPNTPAIAKGNNVPTDKVESFMGRQNSPATPADNKGNVAAPLVSIVIPVFNKMELTRNCLTSLAKVTNVTRVEIVVVDNASTDGTREFLAAEAASGRIRLITNPVNTGFAHACNQGAQIASGSSVIFLNNDTTVTPGWLDAMVKAAGLPNVGVVGAKLLYANDTIQHAGIGFIDGIPDHPYRHLPANAPEANRFREMDMVTGACFLIRRDLFLQLSGFDECYQNGVEDVDLCLRVRAAGWKVVYEPAAVVYHLEGQSEGRFNHVAANLRIFFERWTRKFDSQYRFIEPTPSKIIASSKSFLSDHSAAKPAKKLFVNWVGSFLDHGSLSHVNREFTGAIESLPNVRVQRVSNGAPVSQGFGYLTEKIATTEASDASVTIRHAWPPDWRRPRNGKLVVIQPWEFGSLPVEWVQKSKDVDEFWVPTEYVRRVYVESGVPTEKITIVPNGVDIKRFSVHAPQFALPTKKRYKFLFVGGTIYRKGPDALLDAYLRTFTAQDDVCLVIKDFGGKSVYAGQTIEQSIRQAQQKPNAPEILYLNDEMTPEQIPGLYTACDCLVHPYRGEGFGLPILEAMACGLPVVVTAGGAADDFATDDVAYKIASSRKPLGSKVGEFQLVRDGWLLEPDIAELSSRMRWIVENVSEAKAKGHAASIRVGENWSWAHAAKKAADSLQKLTERNDTSSATSGAVEPRKPFKLPVCALKGNLTEARALLKKQNLSNAWKTTISSLESRPFHPEAYLLLSEIALAAGDSVAARKCAQHSLKLAPGYRSAKQFLKGKLRGNNHPEWLVIPGVVANTETEAKPRMTVCVITKNEERFLGRCLESVKDLAWQIVVTDTGSTDKTVEIAKKYGAEIGSFTWCDDFSAARNASLEHVRGDWVLFLDADEELLPEHRETIIAEMRRSDVIGYREPIIDVGREAEGCSYVPRLFRNAPALFYVGRVHEQIFTSLLVRSEEWGMKVELGKSALLHHGYTKELVADRDKVNRNLKLLELAVEELPNEPNLLMNLGLELVRSGQLHKGIEKTTEALHLLSRLPDEQVTPELRETLLTQLSTHLMAAKSFREIVGIWQTPFAKSSTMTATHHFLLGLSYMEMNQPNESIAQMEQCITKRDQPGLSPAHKEIFTGAPHHCMALSHVALKDHVAAEKCFRLAVEQPNTGSVIRIDFANFKAQKGEPIEAFKILTELTSEDASNIMVWYTGAKIALSQPDFIDFALDWTLEAANVLPEAKPLLAQRAEALLLSQNLEDALPLWRANHDSANPRHLAALILCEVLQGSENYSLKLENETVVSQEFLKWYRLLLHHRANAIAGQINQRLEEFLPVLPSAAKVLGAAIRQAAEPAAA